MVCFVGECQNGAGKHIWDVELALFPDLLRWQYAHGILYEQAPSVFCFHFREMMLIKPRLVTGISAVKVSVAFFLLRLIQGKWHRRFIIGTVGQ